MRRPLLIAVSAIALITAGFAAYTIGSRVGSGLPTQAGSSSEIVGTAFQNPIDVSNVVLSSANNQQITLADYKGEVTLIYFGFTRCPDVCPITLGRLAQTYEELGNPDDLNVAMITVDPEFDTPDITHSYASGFHPEFIGLSGSNSEVAEVMKQFFVAAGGEGAEIFHTDVVFVLNRDAQIKYLYGPDKAGQLSGNLATLMAQANW